MVSFITIRLGGGFGLVIGVLGIGVLFQYLALGAAYYVVRGDLSKAKD